MKADDVYVDPSALARLYIHQDGVLHVACTLELKLSYFLTFDSRQQQLAGIAGLKAVKV